jgi:hypothetical protein
LVADPERHFIALLSAHIVLGKLKGLSEACVLETFAAARLGVPVQKMVIVGWRDLLALARRARATPPELKKLATIERRGPDGLVGLYKWQLGQQGSESRNINAFRPYVDNWRHKLNIIRKKPSTDADLIWLDRMTAAWILCLRGEIARARHVELLTSLMGEKAHFEAVMWPVLRGCASQRMAGLKQLDASPEYLVNLIRRVVPEK